MHKLGKSNKLSINISELNFCQDQYNWKHKLLPIEINKNDSERVVNLILYKNHYVLIKKLIEFLGIHNKNFVCGRCLEFFTIENMLILNEPKCEKYNLTIISISSESHFHWKDHFHWKALNF